MRFGELLFRPLDRRLERLHQEIRSSQALALRAYEAATHDAARKLELIRSDPEYEASYSESEPLVTVRIATCDRAQKLISRAVPSVLAQTYENWEAVIVGDNCTDNTEQLLRSVGDPRIRFVNLPYRGPYASDPKGRWHMSGYNAKNTGLRLSRGRWVAPLDDDDEFDPDHIEVLLAHARETRAELAYGNLRVVDGETKEPVSGHRLCEWPPKGGGFNFLASIFHAGLTRFEYDPNCHFANEVDDVNRLRRLWEGGVRFSHLNLDVGTYYYVRKVWP